MTARTIRVGHSPDADDAFMFYALARARIPTGAYRYEHILEDIETLNRRALRGELEVTALSLHAYAYVTERYALMDCGASLGDGYGPIVVARQALPVEDLRRLTVAVPGTLTTAFLALRLMLGEAFAYEVVPFDQILPAVAAGRFDAGLLIHEGQLTFAEAGLRPVVDLGRWWQQQTGLPLPLGGNAVRRDLGPEAMHTIVGHVRQSIRYGLEHRPEALAYAMTFARDLDAARADRFVGLYVNEASLGYDDRARRAVETLLARAAEAGLAPGGVHVEFVS